MEAFLQAMLPRILPEGSTFDVYVFQGKHSLLKKLGNRLRGYTKWMPENYRVVVVTDRDSNDCRNLKEQLEAIAKESGLVTRSRADGDRWQVVNRIAIEELEAWYFGDWEAVCRTYPRVSPHIPNQYRYRDPDAIRGGTWESFERIMQSHGYFRGGLTKVKAASTIGGNINPLRSRSKSFNIFYDATMEATAQETAASF